MQRKPASGGGREEGSPDAPSREFLRPDQPPASATRDGKPEPESRLRAPTSRGEVPRPGGTAGTVTPGERWLRQKLGQASDLYETAMFDGDAAAREKGIGLLREVLVIDPGRAEARQLLGRFETLGRMLDASPHRIARAGPAPSRITVVPRARRKPDRRATPRQASPSTNLTLLASSPPVARRGRWVVAVAVLVAVLGMLGVTLYRQQSVASEAGSDVAVDAPVAPAAVTPTGGGDDGDVTPTRTADDGDEEDQEDRALVATNGATPVSTTPASPVDLDRAETSPARSPAARGTSAGTADRLLFEVVLSEEHDRIPFDGVAVPEPALARLDALATRLAELPGDVTVEIEGHTDTTGPADYNELLGRARAESVRAYLNERHQVPLETIRVVSFGEQRPVATNETEEGRARNRRVSVRVVRGTPAEPGEGAGP